VVLKNPLGWVHSRGDGEIGSLIGVDRLMLTQLLLGDAIGLWFPGYAPELLKFAGFKGSTFDTMEFCLNLIQSFVLNLDYFWLEMANYLLFMLVQVVGSGNCYHVGG